MRSTDSKSHSVEIKGLNINMSSALETQGGAMDFGAESSQGKPQRQSSTSFLSFLGIDKCLYMMGFGPRRKNSSTSEESKVKGWFDSEDSSNSFALGKWVNGVMKHEKGLDEHVQVLKEGALFWRKLAGGQPKTAWVSLQVAKDNCSAELEWRNPQLVLNKPIDRDSVSLDEIKEVRGVEISEADFFPEGSITMQANGVLNSLAVVTAKRVIVLEASNKEQATIWITSLQAAVHGYVPVLDANRQKQLQDDRRVQEIDERKKSRDSRRAEYAKAGMSNTARIMAQGTAKA